MTVSSEVSNAGPYFGNGVATVFPYGFKIVSDEHLRVTIIGADSQPHDLSLDAGDYTVTGVGNEAGGDILKATPLLAGERLFILRKPPFTQETSLENQGAYYPNVVEDRFDMSVMQIQTLKDVTDRSVTTAIGVAPLQITESVADGRTLMKKGGAIVAGPDLPALAASLIADASAQADRARDEADRSDREADRADAEADRAAGYVNDIVSEKEVPITATRNGMEALEFPAGVNSLETRGYAAMGDGRGEQYVRVEIEPTHTQKVRSDDRFLPDGSLDPVNGGWWELAGFRVEPTTVPRPYYSRQRDTISALDAMASGGLDEAVRNSEATDADATEITDNLQEVVDFCVSKKRGVFIPCGVYKLNNKLQASGPVPLRGDGMGSARLQWVAGAVASGIEVDVSAAPRPYEIENLALETFGVAEGSAIKFDHSGLISGGFIMPRAETHAKINNVLIRGATGYTVNGWNVGVEGVSMLGMDINSSRINGVYTGSYGTIPNAQRAVWFHGEGSPVQLNVDRSVLSAFKEGILSEDAEGIYISDTEIVTVQCGVKVNNQVGESGFRMSGGHIATLELGVDLDDMADGWVRDVNFYNVADAPNVTCVIVRSGGRNFRIEGNVFRRLGAVTTMLGVHLQGGINTIIGPNTFDVGSSNRSIKIEAAVVNARIHRQDYVSSAATQIENDSATSLVEVFRNFSGNIDNIVCSNHFPEQTHTLTAAATGTFPTDVTNKAACIVKTMGNDTNTARQTLESPSQNRLYMRRKVSGSWTAWTRFDAV